MKLIFFLNCLSPHQIPYIKELPTFHSVEEVIVVVPFIDYEERKIMGWDCSKLLEITNLTFFINPSKGEVKKLYYDNNNHETYCFYSGINAFREVSQWFKTSLRYNVRRCIITEPPYIYKHPIWQHKLRFAIRDWKYVKYIDNIFVMGEDYVGYYKKWNKKWNVVPFMYCTEWVERNVHSTRFEKDNRLRIIYVGSLSQRKNVKNIFNAISLLDNDIRNNIEVGIVGDGEQRQILENIVELTDYNKNVIFYGNQSMENVHKFMEQYDILVLPSLHDGWGAVINEALIMGLYVICSDNTGAKSLLKSRKRGLVFKTDSDVDLKRCIEYSYNHRLLIRSTIQERIQWSKETISGHAIAKYFMKNLI